MAFRISQIDRISTLSADRSSDSTQRRLSLGNKNRLGGPPPSMFSTFASVPSRPSSPDVHREVQNLLDVQGITFGTLVANALRDKTTTLGTTVVRELPNILESLRPHLDEDEESRVLLSEFFASIVSSELSRFERDDNEASWSLPATSLSTERLTKFNLKEMGKKISSETPALSSFLHRICGGKKLDDCEMDVDEKSEVEDELEFGTERRQKASPAQLLEIVSLFISHIFVAYTTNRGR